jgi:hypothetical protein
VLLMLTRERIAVLQRLDNSAGFAFSSILDHPTMYACDVRQISQMERSAASAIVPVDLDL